MDVFQIRSVGFFLRLFLNLLSLLRLTLLSNFASFALHKKKVFVREWTVGLVYSSPFPTPSSHKREDSSLSFPPPLHASLCMEKAKFWRFFKHCSRCSQKIPLTDGHKLCLFCLGETHNVEACNICAQFSCQAKRNRAAHLSVFLLEKSLRPQNSPMEPKALEVSASTGTPMAPVPIASVSTKSQSAKSSVDQTEADLPHIKVTLPLPTGSDTLAPPVSPKKQSKTKKYKRVRPADPVQGGSK